MSYVIGRNFNIGLAHETVRGTAVYSAYCIWFPKMNLTWDDQIDYAVNNASYGINEDAEGQDITGKKAEGTLEGRIQDLGIGVLLCAALGTETLSTAATSVYDHNFTMLQSSQHPSITILTSGANENSGNGHSFARGMLQQLDLSFEINKYAMFKAQFQSDTAAVATNTKSYPVENYFRPQDGSVKIATAISTLGAANAISLRKFSLTLKKNLEEDRVIGSVTATDRLNTEFSAEGSLEIVYTDRSYIDTIMLGDLQKAVRIQFTNTSTTIGTASNPTLTLDLAKVKLQDVARKIDNKSVTTQTIKFKAFYSIADLMMMTCTIRNTRSTAY